MNQQFNCAILIYLFAVFDIFRCVDSINSEKTTTTEPSSSIRIAFYNGGGTFTGSKEHESEFYDAIYNASNTLSAKKNTTYTLTNITEHDIAIKNYLTLERFDVAIFPGGSGDGQASALGENGMEAVKSFVRSGGAYVGTCGGAFLAISHLGLYGEPSPPTIEPWNRGHGPVAVEFTATGLSDLQLPIDVYGANRNVTIEYWQGPIIAISDLAKYAPQVRMLSMFRTEIHNQHTNETTGTMINTPAMTSATYGKGRVVLNSPHPEIPPEASGGHHGLETGRTRPEIYVGGLVWALGYDRPLLAGAW